VAKKGQTYGHVKQNAFANRVSYKPSLRKPVIRHPGVMRKSDAVIARNEKLEALEGSDKHPARICAGLLWPEFIECLSDEMKKIMK